MLYFLQDFFHAGNVTIHGNAAMFQVIKLTDLFCIIEHFTNYPLKTQKHADYLLFKKAFDIISNKEHLTKTGLDKLVSLRSVLNKGLSERLQLAFPDIKPALRPKVSKPNLHANNVDINSWIAGFVSGEGCFFIKAGKSETHKLGISITLNFIVNQNVRDAYLLESFIRVLDCGSLYITEKTGIARFTVVNFTDIVEKIIPFFDEYPIFGSKYKDFQDFKQASILMKSKSHLTKQGLEQIVLIKAGMNFKR